MEEWKDIPGYEGLYEASNLGQIRSKEGKTTSSRRFKKRVWKQRIIKQKYKKVKNRKDMMVTLWKDGKPYYYLVARLIATTFHENLINTNMTVNHIDSNPLNNCADNLEWLTIADNISYGMVNGQFSNIMKSISATDYKNNKSLNARSYAEMDRLLNQYQGYTSRMMIMNSDVLFDKSGNRFEILRR